MNNLKFIVMNMLANLAIFGSGKGSNFIAIANAIAKEQLNAKIKIVISDKKNAPILKKAKKMKIKSMHIPYHFKQNALFFHQKCLQILQHSQINLIILAGFMRIIKEPILTCYKNKILNIHPSLLPQYKGLRAWEQALKASAKITGATVHLVEKKIDSGKIIAQQKVKIYPNDTPEKLFKRIQKIEHEIYPRAIEHYLQFNQNFH